MVLHGTTSRHPSPSKGSDDPPRGFLLESTVAAAIRNDACNLVSITWDRLFEETTKDDASHDGFPEKWRTLPLTAPFWQYHNSFHITDGVFIYNDRVV